MVQVVLGEQHGAGIKIGSRCLWDADTDNYASDVFINVSNLCIIITVQEHVDGRSSITQFWSCERVHLMFSYVLITDTCTVSRILK